MAWSWCFLGNLAVLIREDEEAEEEEEEEEEDDDEDPLDKLVRRRMRGSRSNSVTSKSGPKVEKLEAKAKPAGESAARCSLQGFTRPSCPVEPATAILFAVHSGGRVMH